jgi:hypothetical protein
MVRSGAALLGGAEQQAVEIMPSGATVPANLLRIELRFAQPLRVPLRIDDVELLDADGQPIDSPFLDLPLPSADGRRVTILLHPGRLKSGLQAHERLGRALREGEVVSLVVHCDGSAPLGRRQWCVVAEDLDSPLPQQWRLQAPDVGSQQPLVVHFEAPLSPTAVSYLAVGGSDGRPLAGQVALVDGETTWRFTPDHAWTTGAYELLVHPDLEDPAGNRVGVRFEQLGACQVSDGAVTRLSFDVCDVHACTASKWDR